MPECVNPIWPCALTGAVSCLAGFRDLAVVIHGSSGCYYYPKSLIKAPIYGSFILNEEVIFGTGGRLRSVVSEIMENGSDRVAVVTSCVPALMGEDLASELDGLQILLVDAPGFLGDAEAGYRIAAETLLKEAQITVPGVNIGGICLLDPFWRGNMHESERILAMAGIPVGAVLSYDQLDTLSHAAPVTVAANPDYEALLGRPGGSLLGLPSLKQTLIDAAHTIPDADPAPVLAECERAEEMAFTACEKYLRRNDPPIAAICAQAGYASLFADLLCTYLGAKRPLILPRNVTDIPANTDYDQIRSALLPDTYDLVIGSSYEARILPDAAFVGITPPNRGQIMLGSRPLAGIEGTLHAVEMILNAVLDQKKKDYTRSLR
ncbi:MAG: Mo-nitrogenase MoFe protein subunit NifK [Methanomicrobiales archaeon 53_19]|uniref:nitrogenase component 1 n=1 Tax=Methanocalculus sp. TaxID=2004547 RepID=UPI0007494A07|nr:nitrogenase component 1 [Methanocalculus sp.]KUK68710.1 MAG: Mo-nitrogenase MoFe protein subunit NifK [Methanocalculus sp. 52_23]KUL03521.1 MAG: Mo-nitrogenase MoFe protein subunit NifK [Methanomicrobiales archaeon 53_19]HIJ06741.1 oxidoreductase [Methanocalculus sp.]